MRVVVVILMMYVGVSRMNVAVRVGGKRSGDRKRKRKWVRVRVISVAGSTASTCQRKNRRGRRHWTCHHDHGR